MRLLRFAHNDENSRIPRLKSRIPRDCFASLAMTNLWNSKIQYRDPRVKPKDDTRRSSRGILNEIAPSALLPRNDGFFTMTEF